VKLHKPGSWNALKQLASDKTLLPDPF